MIHAILGTALTAAGEARKAALVTMVSLLPTLAMLILLIHVWGGAGAALSNALIVVISGAILGMLVWRRFKTLMNQQIVRHITLAGCLMFSLFVLLPDFGLFFLLPCAAALATYFVALIALREITRRDFAALFPWMRVESYQVSSS